jgi:hypothetical protein
LRRVFSMHSHTPSSFMWLCMNCRTAPGYEAMAAIARMSRQTARRWHLEPPRGGDFNHVARNVRVEFLRKCGTCGTLYAVPVLKTMKYTVSVYFMIPGIWHG